MAIGFAVSHPGSVVAVPDFTTFWNSHEMIVREICDLVGIPSASHRESLIVSPLRRLARLCFLAPASESHHDAHPGGLVEHTLAVAKQALEVARTRQEWEYKDRLALLVICVCHDLGKIHQITVTGDVDGRALPWVPHDLTMAKWCESNRLTQISMEWRPGRPTSGELSIEPIGLNYATSVIFPIALVTLIGVRRYNTLLHALTRAIGPPSVDYFPTFKFADIHCSRSSRGSDPAKTFLQSLRDAILHGEAPVNVDDADVYRSTTHTIIALPHGAHGQTWSAACTMFLADKEGADGEVLTNQVLSDVHGEFARWPGIEPTSLRAKHYVIRAGQPDLLAVIISNTALWGDYPVDSWCSPYTGRIAFQRPCRTRASLDAAELGFRASPPLPIAPPPPSVPKPAPLDADMGEAHRRRRRLIAEIWKLANPLKSKQSAPIDSAIAKTGEMPKEHLDLALELLWDRLKATAPRRAEKA